MSLTGKIRYRISWRGKVILQVQDSKWVPGPLYAMGGMQNFFRDARISDFNLLDMKTPEACPAQQASTTEN